MYDVRVAGHLLKEHTRRGGVRGRPTLGGPAAAAARAYAARGLRVLFLTRLRPRDAESGLTPLRAAGVTVHVTPDRATTWFEAVYRGRDEAPRHVRVLARAAPLPPAPRAAPPARFHHLVTLWRGDLPPPWPPGPRVLAGSGLAYVVARGRLAEEAHPELERLLRGTALLGLTVREALLLARASTPREAARFLRAAGAGEVLLFAGPEAARVYGPAGERDLSPAPTLAAALAAAAAERWAGR